MLILNVIVCMGTVLLVVGMATLEKHVMLHVPRIVSYHHVNKKTEYVHHARNLALVVSVISRVQPTVLKTCAIKRAVSAHIIAAQDSLLVIVIENARLNVERHVVLFPAHAQRRKRRITLSHNKVMLVTHPLHQWHPQ